MQSSRTKHLILKLQTKCKFHDFLCHTLHPDVLAISICACFRICICVLYLRKYEVLAWQIYRRHIFGSLKCRSGRERCWPRSHSLQTFFPAPFLSSTTNSHTSLYHTTYFDSNWDAKTSSYYDVEYDPWLRLLRNAKESKVKLVFLWTYN